MNVRQNLINLLTKEFDLGRHSHADTPWHGAPNELKNREQRVDEFFDKNSSLPREQDKLVPLAGVEHDNGW